MNIKLCLVLALTVCLVQEALSGVSIIGPQRGENRRVCGGLVIRSNFAYCRSYITCTRSSQCPRQSRCPLTQGRWRCQGGECLCWERGTNHVVAQNIHAYGTGDGDVVGLHVGRSNARINIGGK